MMLAALLLLVAGSSAASANDGRDALRLSGFIKPVFSAVVRDAALPEDQLDIGLRSSRGGLVLAGDPLPQWRYRLFFVLGGDTFPALVRASAVDANNDGAVDGIATATRPAIGDLIREASITWQVVDEHLQVRAGQMPVPLTSAAQSADVALLFADRAGPNDLFLADDDLGALVEAFAPDQIVQARVGLFNGTGTGASGGQRGVLYLARVDVQPLGEFTFDETDPTRTDARLGLGAGLIWHPYRAFDGVGFPRVRVNDLRAAVSLRAGVAGFHVALEALHRLQVDGLSNRPVTASGAYIQGGWRLPAGIEPIFRFGWAVEDRSFDPRATVWTEAGFNLYPAIGNEVVAKRDDLRVTVAYQGEHRVTEGESAHAAVASVVLGFE